MNFKDYAYNVTSQFGENGLLAEMIRRIGLPAGVAIEFGAPTMQYCSNIYPLRGHWDIRYFDLDPQEEGIVKAEITPGNVNELIPECQILSIDCDGPDAGIWSAYKGKPDIVIIEINSSLDPSVDFYHPSRGANYSYMKRLGEAKGYTLLCHTGNMLFVSKEHAELFPDRDETFNTSWL